jgi:hypothetical protein
MVKAATHLAAGAIAAAFLLAGAGGAIAAADTPSESAGSESANGTASDSGPAPSPHPADNNSFSSSSENAGAAGDEADKAVESNGAEAKDSTRAESSAEQTEEKKPVEPDHSTTDSPGKTINRVPLGPEAPPLELVPLPEAPLAPALEAPPPADVPPVIPATPTDPDTVDAVADEARHHPGGNEPPVLTVPILVAPAPLPPTHILGASIAPRLSSGAVDPAPQGAAEALPRLLLRASAGEPLLHSPSLTSFSVTTPGQIPYRTGYNEYSSKPLAEVAAGALPGVAGLVFMTAGGICLGYRQARMAQQLPAEGVHRFMN